MRAFEYMYAVLKSWELIEYGPPYETTVSVAQLRDVVDTFLTAFYKLDITFFRK